MKKILVIGSSNMDMVMHVNHLPKPGETIGNGTFSQHHGGKGANQAVAAARAGGSVTFATCLGDDVFASQILEGIQCDGIDASLISHIPNCATGTALIYVDAKGENAIGVAPGANAMLNPEYIEAISEDIKKADIILLQQEIPIDSVTQAIRYASKAGKQVILNTAPAFPLPHDILSEVNTLIMNETETEIMSGFDLADLDVSADYFLDKGVKNVIITLGSEGSFIKNNNQEFRVPAFEVTAVDTVAAGDVFCGCLAAALARGNELEEAVWFATGGAAISVTRQGAQPSAPTEEEILEFIVAMS